MSLPLNNIIRVTDSIETSGTLTRDLGIGLYITPDDTLGTGSNRLQVYADFDTSLAETFSSDSNPYKAGSAWFSQIPTPKNLVIARWFPNAVAAKLVGGKVTATAADFAALLATGYVAVTVGGTLHDVNVDLTSVSSYADIALAVQNALTGDGAAVTVTFDTTETAFVVSPTATGSASTITAFSVPGTGVDIGTLMKLGSSDYSSLNDGADAETISEAFESIRALQDIFYFVMLDLVSSDAANVVELSDLMESSGGRYMYSSITVDSTALTTGETSSYAYELSTKQPQRTFMTYSGNSDFKDVSIAARFSSVNFSSSNSTITAKFKQLPTLVSDSLTETQVTELDTKRVNFYTDFANTSIYAEGTCFKSNVYIDIRYGLDWFVNAVQVAVFDLYLDANKVGQTDSGEASIVNVILNVCRQAKSNGLIAGGVVSEAMKADIIATTGNTSFDGSLYNGYLVWSEASSAQSEADRNARKSTAKKIWLKSEGASHSADIAITFEN